jgi:hypothetical protein
MSITTKAICVASAAAIVAACGGGVSLGNLPSGETGSDDGGAQGDDGGSSGGIGTGTKECSTKTACGPAPSTGAIKCSDGSIGGNTGRCIETADGACAWEIRECPPDACFDDGGALLPEYKKCATNADCTVLTYQMDCCGNTHAAGVASASQTTVKTCADARAAGFPKCGCPQGPPVADDGSTGGIDAKAPSVACNASGVCETSFVSGVSCAKTTCKPGQTCCEGPPLPSPTCVDGTVCPVSRRVYKKDIRYLGDDDRARLAEELMSFPLATYRYKSDDDAAKKQLGFIIDDVVPSPAVTPSGDRVDMYGYQSMAVAALQVQARQIAELRREVDALKRTCAKPPARR